MITFRARFRKPPVLLRDRAYRIVTAHLGNACGILAAVNDDTGPPGT